MSAGEGQPQPDPRMTHEEYLGQMLFVMSGLRFQREVVRQAVHYAEQVLPSDEDDEGERTCLASARAWSDDASAENLRQVQSAADLISANAMEGIRTADAVRHAVLAALANTPIEAAREAVRAVEDAAARKAVRGHDDYMGRAVAARAGRETAEAWQHEMAMVLAHVDAYDDPIPPFLPLPVLPDDPGEVLARFREIYSEEDAYSARDLAVLLDYMTPEQQLRFKQSAVSQAIGYAEALLPLPEEDLGERAVLAAARRWVERPTEENAGAADLLPEVTRHATPPLLWTFSWAADTQPEPHATPAATYVARAVRSAIKSVPHEARMAAAELAQARARQWQTAAAEVIVQGGDPPEPGDNLTIATGARGAYLEGRLALLVHRMTEQQRILFKQAVVRHAVEQAERVLPPEEYDRGHRRCLEAARRWLAYPTEANARAAHAAAWAGTEGAPTYLNATPAESAAWLAARGAAEAAAEADVHRAALVANVLALVAMALDGVDGRSKWAGEAVQRGKTRYIEIAWRILQGEEPPHGEADIPGESLGTVVQEMSPDQLNTLAGALERQARWYSEHAPGPPPAPWLARPESGAASGVDIGPGLESEAARALKALAAARAPGAESRLSAVREGAEAAWKAAMYAGERQAAERQVEAAWAILRGADEPPVGADAHGSDSPAIEAPGGSGAEQVTPGSEGDKRMASSRKSDRVALQELLSEDPEAKARFEELKDFEREMCYRWIAGAPTSVLREQRIARLARRLWLTSFDPYYDTGPDLMLPELDDLYGTPRPFSQLSPEEQALALQERRALGANHYRNYDDAGTWFRVLTPDDKPLDDMLVVYERPCVITEDTVGWLNRNGWETMREVYEWFDMPADDTPPAPTPEPLRIEDTTAGELRPEAERHTGPVLALTVTPGGARAVSASADGTLRVWDAGKGVSTHVLSGHSGPVRAVGLMPGGARAVSASDDGTVRLWDLGTGEPLRRLSGHEGAVLAVAPLPNGEGVVSASADGALAVWHFTPDASTVVLHGHSGPVLHVAVSPDGGRVVSASADGTVRVWDSSTGQQLQVLQGHTGPVTQVAFTPDGERVVSASEDGTLRVWNPSTGRTRALLLGHNGPVRALVLMADGHRTISTSDDGTFRMWNIAGASSGISAGHAGPVVGASIASQGWGERFVWLSPLSLLLVQGMPLAKAALGAVSASEDGTLRLWDLSMAANTIVLDARVPFTCCAMSPGGEMFAAGDEQGQMHFLQLTAG
jgi:WD40 repeat protein